MRIAGVGQAVFAATMIGIGFAGFVAHDFAPIWQPVPKTLPAREALVHATALLSLATGIGLLVPRVAARSAGVLLVALALWLLAFKLHFVVRAPLSAVSYETCSETIVLVAAAWTLFVSVVPQPARPWPAFAAGERGVRLARVPYGLAMVAFGIAHFAYLAPTAALVPSWLPAPTAWASLTGATYIGAGIAILGGIGARLAATLSALQMGGFTLLVWLPTLFAGPSTDQWNEFVVSWALTAAGWVVADAYRGRAWFARETPVRI